MCFEIFGNQFVKNWKNIKIISGAVHYFRNLPDTWDDIFEKMKAYGLTWWKPIARGICMKK